MKTILTFALLFVIPVVAMAREGSIRNDLFWHCDDGSPIYSQGGGIFRFADSETGRMRYYWYGMHYKEAEMYAANPSMTYDRCTFESITCYVSDDLVNWSFLGDALTKEEVSAHTHPYWVGRMGVAKIDSVYAIFVQCNQGVLVAESPTPDGEFKWARLIDMKNMIGTSNTGDQTVFTDEDTGKSYLVCSKGSGRNKIFVAEIGRMADGNIGLIDCTEVFTGAGREGNCMFKHDSRYYLCASNLYGWDASYAYFLVADNVKGPYRKVIPDYQRPANDYPDNPQHDMQVMPGCEQDYAHITQTGFFYTLKSKSKEIVLYCGDRWANFAGNGLGYNQWVPLSFIRSTDGTDIPCFNSLSSWNLDAETCTWSVADDNNYALNGSFEADRRIIPMKEKPRQGFITGWTTEYLRGSKATVEDTLSPRLNYEKAQAERMNTIGEKALLITDNKNFVRQVSQTIESTPFVTLPQDNFTMTAKVKLAGRFKRLYIFATSDGKTFKQDIPLNKTEDWQTITLNNIEVRGGRAVIGIYADGKAKARCLVDDVEFYKEQNK